MTVSDTPCSRCDRNIARTNEHPDKLCGRCQQELRSFLSRVESAQRTAWIAAGRPRITRRERELVQTLDPAPEKWPTPMLLAATRELLRRRRAAVASLEASISWLGGDDAGPA